MKHTTNITVAFKSLRKLGYFARQNFMCCQSCGWAAVPEGKDEKVVFFHQQDAGCMKAGRPLYLAWSGDGNQICNMLREHGMEVVWDGTNNTRICITSGY
jgi:hypothetical protein